MRQRSLFRTALVWWYSLFVFLIGAYTIFSYSLTDPNLVLTTWMPYWHFQTWIWETVFTNNVLLTQLYTILVVSLSVVYMIVITLLKKNEPVKRAHLLGYGLILVILLFSYNALSHDVFNYMFNAKIVVVYHNNPSTVTALDYPQDLWVRFMHNVHTPAPYGLGWTILSLVPYVFGMNKFLITWLLFRMIEIIAVWLLYKSLQLLSLVIFKRELWAKDAALLFLNPLFLIEIISNMHNDLWMMVPALFFVALFLKQITLNWTVIVTSLGLFFLSVSVKFATVLILIPVGMLWVQDRLIQRLLTQKIGSWPYSYRLISWIKRMGRSVTAPYAPLLCSVLMFVPLFTARSQQFHPWYLIWSLCWIPVISQRWWKAVLILFSFSSLLRYIPWLYQGGFSDHTVWQQKVVTWVGAAIGIFVWWCLSSLVLKKNRLNLV